MQPGKTSTVFCLFSGQEDLSSLCSEQMRMDTLPPRWPAHFFPATQQSGCYTPPVFCSDLSSGGRSSY